MATTEYEGVLTYLDDNGDEHILYPKTNDMPIDLTQAEYDALSDEEKMKNTYYITDAEATGGVTREEFDKLSLEIANQQTQIDNKQPKGNYLTSIPTEYVTEDELNAKGYLTSVPSEYVTADEVKAMGIQQIPLFANNLEECTDTTKVYVLPDGYIYGYVAITTPGGAVPNFTNLLDAEGAYIKEGYRYSHSGQAWKEISGSTSYVFPIPKGEVTLRVKRYGFSGYNGIYTGVTNEVFTDSVGANPLPAEDAEIATATFNNSNCNYAVITVKNDYVDIITANEEITYTTSEDKVIYEWANTGRAFVPADYEDRILEAESNITDLENRVSELEDENTVGSSTNIIPEGLEWLVGYNIPRLILNGDTTGMTKENAVTLTYECNDKDGIAKSGSCTLKWQGSSSIQYEKKNYTIKFDNTFEVVDGWGEEKKYCLKANFIDHSHARNLVSAKLWGNVVKNRASVDERLTALVNGGAVDGFPIIIILNGEFHGLYTWNIPKDGWMFGMKDESIPQAIVCCDGYHDSSLFKGLTTLTEGVDFSFEYSNDDETEWVKTSLNRMLQAVIDSDGTDLDTTVSQYIDIDSFIDYAIYSVLTRNNDGIFKNYILATFDGVKWFFSAYDLDSTFGLSANGLYFQTIDAQPTFESWRMNRLFDLLWTHKRANIQARYNEIRSSAMSEANVMKTLLDFGVKIPKAILLKDVEKWTSIPSTYVNDISQILNQYRLRCLVADEWIKG